MLLARRNVQSAKHGAVAAQRREEEQRKALQPPTPAGAMPGKVHPTPLFHLDMAERLPHSHRNT